MASGRQHDIGRFERVCLELVFGGPVWLWLVMARLVGVKVRPDALVDDSLLIDAEEGARTAARWFAWGLPSATFAMVAMFAWYPVQDRLLEPYMHVGYHSIVEKSLTAGTSFGFAVVLAGATLIATALVVGMIDATVFGGIPVYLLRCCTAAAEPAVAVALAKQDHGEEENIISAYPRVSIAVRRLLHPRRRA